MSTSIPSSVSDLKNYIKANLGSDIVRVEITEDQYNIIIDDSLQKFFNYVYDGYDKVYQPITLPTTGTTGMSTVTLPNNILSVVKVFGQIQPLNFKVYSYIYEPSNIIANREYTFSFSKYSHILTINETPEKDTAAVAYVYRKLDETIYTDLYNHEWLKKYIIAKAKIQWGQNLSKYGSVVLPGGMTLNGEFILNEGKEEYRLAEEELYNNFAFYPLPQVM